MSRSQNTLALKRKRDGGQSSQSIGDADRVVLNIIKAKENLGISIGDIRRDTKLPHTQVNKSIKTLMGKKLIKEVPNIKYRGGKHYMASEFEPSKELTGGAWYVDGKLDKDFIGILKDLCLKIIGKLKVATAEGVYEFFKRNKIAKVEVSSQQIAEILRSMVLDNEILEVKSTGLAEYHSIPIGEVCYRCVTGVGIGQAQKTGAMASIPCGVCPRISMCTPDGIISPSTCVYYTEWLNF